MLEADESVDICFFQVTHLRAQLGQEQANKCTDVGSDLFAKLCAHIPGGTFSCPPGCFCLRLRLLLLAAYCF